MRGTTKVDGNQARIVRLLRDRGCTVTSLASVGAGCPDIIVGYMGQNFLFEVKDPDQPKHRHKLTAHEAQWHAAWKGQVKVIFTAKDALTHIDHVTGGRTAGA